jgi:hypothetical protein
MQGMKLTRLQWLGVVAWLLICVAGYFLIFRAIGGKQAISNAVNAGKTGLGLVSNLLAINDVSGAQIQTQTSWVNGESNTQLTVTLDIDVSCVDEKAKCERIVSQAASSTLSTYKDLNDNEDLVIVAANEKDFIIFNFSYKYTVTKTVAEWKKDPTATIKLE